MSTATIEPKRAERMNPDRHSTKAAFWGTVAVGLTGATPATGDMLNPQAMAALVGSVAALCMALTSLLNAGRPYFDRLMDAREKRRAAP